MKKGNNEAIRAPVVMLGSGRCGSTLLQRILNSSPEITVWGEHGGFLKGIANAYATLAKNEFVRKNLENSYSLHNQLVGEFNDSGKSINWVNPFNQETVRDSFRTLLMDLFASGLNAQKVHWGFKEILYGKQDRVVEMWDDLFPDTRYVFSIREPYSVIKSMLIAWHRHRVLRDDWIGLETVAVNCAQRWASAGNGMLQWLALVNGRSLLVRYEDLIERKEESVETLFDFIGVPMPEKAMESFAIRVEETGNSDLVPKVEAFLSDRRSQIEPIIEAPARLLRYSS